MVRLQLEANYFHLSQQRVYAADLLGHGLEAGHHVPEGEDAAPGGEECGGLAPVVTPQPHLGAGELVVVPQLEAGPDPLQLVLGGQLPPLLPRHPRPQHRAPHRVPREEHHVGARQHHAGVQTLQPSSRRSSSHYHV